PSPRSPLLPYTTLFRSPHAILSRARLPVPPLRRERRHLKGASSIIAHSLSVFNAPLARWAPRGERSPVGKPWFYPAARRPAQERSEEHTSELQSRENLV